MAKWHLNKVTGDYNKCGAKPGNCPLGGNDVSENHFGTKKEAQQASETLLEKKFGKFTTNPKEIKQQQTEQLKTLFKIYNQFDDAGFDAVKDYSNLIVRSMVEGKPQKAKKFMDEVVKDLSARSNEHSSALDTDWKMGSENLPEQIKVDDKDITSKRLRLLFEASDYFDDAGIDIANDNSSTIVVSNGPFSKDNEKHVNRAISEFAEDLTRRAEDVEWFKKEAETKYNNLMAEYYSINKW